MRGWPRVLYRDVDGRYRQDAMERQEGTITEMLGFFIILGVLVVVVLRHQIWPNTEGSREKAEEVKEASLRMKREMERSADEIIERMGEHIDRLEHLVEEADQRAKTLEEQIAALRHPALPQRGGSRDDDFDALLSASLAVENEVGHMPPLLRPSSRSASDVAAYRAPGGQPFYDAEDRDGNVAVGDWTEGRSADDLPDERELLTVEAWEKGARPIDEPEIVVSASVADVADLPLTPEEEAWAAAEEGLPEIASDLSTESRAISDEEIPESVSDSDADTDGENMTHTLSERTDTFFVVPERDEDVAALSESLETLPPTGQEMEEEVAHQNEAAGDADVLAVSQETVADNPLTPLSVAASLPDEDSTAQKIRERLSQGHSAADIAREFHIGRGAVELIEQMGKNKTER